MTKFHKDRTKNVDVLLIVTFLAIPKFAQTPSRYNYMENMLTVYCTTGLYCIVIKHGDIDTYGMSGRGEA